MQMRHRPRAMMKANHQPSGSIQGPQGIGASLRQALVIVPDRLRVLRRYPGWDELVKELGKAVFRRGVIVWVDDRPKEEKAEAPGGYRDRHEEHAVMRTRSARDSAKRRPMMHRMTLTKRVRTRKKKIAPGDDGLKPMRKY